MPLPPGYETDSSYCRLSCPGHASHWADNFTSAFTEYEPVQRARRDRLNHQWTSICGHRRSVSGSQDTLGLGSYHSWHFLNFVRNAREVQDNVRPMPRAGVEPTAGE